MEKILHHNIIKIYLMAFFQNAMVVTAVFVPLMQRHGLSMAEVLQTQALFAFTVAFAEVPSGYLADLWGRKNAIVLGALLCVFAFSWLVFANSFTDFLVYECLMGLGISLNSGADLALLYDSQSYLNQNGEPTYHGDNNRHIAKLVAIEGFAGATAAILTSVLTLWSLDWVLWAQALISIFALVFALSLVETPRQIRVGGHRDNWQKVYVAVLKNPLILWTGLAIVVFSLSALYTYWLSQKYWQLQGIPVTGFGYLWAAHCVIRGLTARFASNIESLLGTHKLFLLIALLPVCGFLGMGLIGGWLGVCFGLAFPLSRGISLVVFYSALNKRLGAEFRATVNSLVSLAIRALFIVTGPVLGLWVDQQGVQPTLLLLGIIFTPLFAIVLIPLCGKIKREQPTATVAER